LYKICFNTSACLIDLEAVKTVGFFDEDIAFIEDLDWGRRATRRGYLCLFDGTVILRHLRKYSLKEFKKYFFRGALSEAKLFLKNRIAGRAVRSALYWDVVLASTLLTWISPIPLAMAVAVGFAEYFRRTVGLGRLLPYPITAPFAVAKSVALTAAMLYWLLRDDFNTEKVTVLGEPDWEEQGREVLQIPEGENCSIPPQAKREKPRTGNKQPKAIPKPIHTILSGREDREVSKNAYLDTIRCRPRSGWS
jgi:hypothetical protein